ncbi:ATP-binding protein [Roseovarius sp. CAU 1744]|uniref:ATP-binding protein n=1 Tax=Roseovarius sp. CAU 1744 TaxID=3140368 RepID=UPI00325B783C
MKFSLGFVLAISLAGLQFLAITIVVSTSYLTSETAMLEHARRLLADAGDNASQHSRSFLKPAREAAELSSRVFETGVVDAGNAAQVEKFLFQTLQADPHISGLYYGDEEGNFIYVMRSAGPGPFRTKIIQTAPPVRTTQFIWRTADFAVVEQRFDPEDQFDARERPWYKSAKEERQSIWTAPYIFFSSQQPGITAATPVSHPNGTLRGVIGVDIEIAAISEFLAQLGISENSAAMILNENGDVIAYPTHDQTAPGVAGSLDFVSIGDFADPVARTAFAELAASGGITVETESMSEFDYRKNTYVSLVKPVLGKDLPWTIAIYAPENDFIEGIKDNRQRNIWIAAAVSLVTACLGLVLAELILRPVRAFAVRTALVSQGEAPASQPLPGTYRELERANKTLIDEIAQRREADARILELNRDLSHFSRVDLMGQMATGLAHELSQPLTAISQNIDAAITTAKEQKEPDQELIGILTELDEHAHRGGDIIRVLRGFVRKDAGQKAPFDLNALLLQTNSLLQYEATANDVKIIFETQDIPEVIGNRVQLAQVLVNLVRNAIEAIVDADSPTKEVTIRTRAKDSHVEVWVEDSGPGVAPDIKLFRRFETTKPGGMGLGLSICRTIVETNGGKLWYDRENLETSRFCFTIPFQA